MEENKQYLENIPDVKASFEDDEDSSSFGSTDLVAGTVQALNFDIHIEVDAMGSRQEYLK
jgi:hypothetical protein